MNNRKVKYSFAQWCRDNGHEDWLDLWDYELNKISPYNVPYSANKKFWFKCNRGIHESEEKHLNTLTHRSNHLFCRKCRSFGQYLLDEFGENGIDLYWSDKNKISPFDIFKCSYNKIFVKCQNDKHPDYEVTANHFYRGCRCPVCSNMKVLPNVNSVAATDPEYICYFSNKNDAYKYSRGSNKICDFVCPICGTVKRMKISAFFNFGFSCQACSDGISYPEKFIYSLITQLKRIYGFDFKMHHFFDWSVKSTSGVGNKEYDFVLFYKENIFIIEVHGSQHYHDGFKRLGGKTLYEEQINDTIKYELAINNGIDKDKYIVIDARYSDATWIKTSILNSNILSIFGLNDLDIDWDECKRESLKSLVKECCDLWNSGLRSTILIGEKLGINCTTVYRYLIKASDAGMCEYTTSDLGYLSNAKPIVCIENNYAFSCAKICEDNSENLFGVYISQKGIMSNAGGHIKSTHGYHFKYITKEEFLKLQYLNKSLTFGNVYFYDINDPLGQNLIV